MQQTSLLAYQSILKTGELGDMQKKVWETIKAHPDSTDKEISLYAQMPINCVTPRRNELVKAGFVFNVGKRECSITKRKANTWMILK